MNKPVLAIHAGAGFITRDTLQPAAEQSRREALTAALLKGYAILQRDESALEAVQAAVMLLEDYAEFNAGRGSVLTATGEVEMDAAIMDGSAQRAGAVASLQRVKNPVCAARAVMEHSAHVLLAGKGAEVFAQAQGVEMAASDYFVTAPRRAQLERACHAAAQPPAAGSDQPNDKYGTVGAVACDSKGRLAAATSTGGTTRKLPGRIGDSCLIGAGTWASNESCAVSATGHGESFIRTAFAHEIDTLMRHRGLPLRAAAGLALQRVRQLGARGGCIAVDSRGNVVLPFNTPGMYRGWVDVRGRVCVAIFPGEDSLLVHGKM